MADHWGTLFSLETAVGSHKSAQALGAPGKIKKCRITTEVTSKFFISPCTPISYTAVLRPTAVSRLDQRGVTLTELMVALVMGLATVAAVYSVHLIQVKQRILQEDVMAMQQNARAAMDLMTREIRMAGYDPMGVNRDGSDSNDFSGVAYHPTELQIKSDLNGNGLLTDSNESIVFLYDASTLTLRRKVGRGGRQPLADHIQSLALQYFDQGGAPTTDSTNIRMIEVALTAQTEHTDPQYPKNEGHRTFTLRSRITPRNLGLVR